MGAVTIGDNVVVSANSLVVSDVPSGATVLGVPARVISREATSPYLKNPIMPARCGRVPRHNRSVRNVASNDRTQKSGYAVAMVAACPFPANHGSAASIREMSDTLSDMGHNVHIVTYPTGQEDIKVRCAKFIARLPIGRKRNAKVGPSSGKISARFSAPSFALPSHSGREDRSHSCP